MDEASDDERESTALLGYVDVPISDQEKATLDDTFIGGEPIWPHPDSPPSSELVMCKNCSSPMHLLLQTNSPLADSLYDRIIYLFGCNKPQCRRRKGSVRAIRALLKDPEKMKAREIEYRTEDEKEQQKKDIMEAKKKKNKELTADLFSGATGASSNPFGGNPFESSNPFGSAPAAKTEKKSEEKKKEEPEIKVIASDYLKQVPKGKLRKPATFDVKLPSFAGSLLFIEEEVLDPKNRVLPPLPSGLNVKEAADGNTESSSKMANNIGISKETEEMIKQLDDPTFRHFSDIVSYNASQVLRYDLKGSPLLYNAKDETAKVFYDQKGRLRQEFNIPRPGYHPNGTRQFELQLMPQAISALEDASDIDVIVNGMEWGTIIVATDEDDFIPDAYFDENYVAYVEEWCGVQWEEEIKTGRS